MCGASSPRQASGFPRHNVYDFPVACIISSLSEGEPQTVIRHADGSFWCLHAGGRAESGVFGGFYSDGFSGSRYLEENSGWKEAASICLWDDRQERLNAIQKIADSYMLFGNELWVSCGEPYFNLHETGDFLSVRLEFAKDEEDPEKMMGSELWNIRDTPLLEEILSRAAFSRLQS